MSNFNKFNTTVQYLTNGGGINLASDVCKIMLTNTAPTAANTNYASVSGTELASGNGYTTGGASITSPSSTNSSGTQTFTGTIANPTWTATGSMGPFRYAILYDSTASGQPLLGWWDYGTSLTLSSTQTFAVVAASGILSLQ